MGSLTPDVFPLYAPAAVAREFRANGLFLAVLAVVQIALLLGVALPSHKSENLLIVVPFAPVPLVPFLLRRRALGASLVADERGLSLRQNGRERWRVAWSDVRRMRLDAFQHGLFLTVVPRDFATREVPLASHTYGPLPDLDRLLALLASRGFPLPRPDPLPSPAPRRE